MRYISIEIVISMRKSLLLCLKVCVFGFTFNLMILSSFICNITSIGNQTRPHDRRSISIINQRTLQLLKPVP